jgi:tripartite-type tricarboxylate transporter receptor subunit TctC
MIRPTMSGLRASFIALSMFLCAGLPAHAQSAQAFYESKPQLHMVVSSTPGGGYDFVARLMAKYMSKYLPGNPPILVQNMPGAGGIKAADYIYSVAPKDGTTFGQIDRGVPTGPLLYGKDSNAEYDATKFGWLGSTTREIGVGMVSGRSPAKTVDDFKHVETTLGSNGVEVDPTMYARLMNALLGTKFKVITGYPGQTEYYLAMEKGETDGLFMSGWSGPNTVQAREAFKRGEIVYFVQMTAQPVPEFGNTPTIMQLLTSEDDRKMTNILLSRLDLGRPFLAPPDIPADRLEMLRSAFWQAVNDPELKDEADKASFSISPIAGAEAQKMIQQVYATPQAILQRIQEIVHK